MFMQNEPFAMWTLLELFKNLSSFLIDENATGSPGISRKEKYADGFAHNVSPSAGASADRAALSPTTDKAEKRRRSHQSAKIFFWLGKTAIARSCPAVFVAPVLILARYFARALSG
jgi:hypothetical protein